MQVFDVKGACVQWSDNEFISFRCKLIIEAGKLPHKNDPILLFLEKARGYRCFVKSFSDKCFLTIKECKRVKARLNRLIRNWKHNHLRNKAVQLVELLERAIYNRRRLYFYYDNLIDLRRAV